MIGLTVLRTLNNMTLTDVGNKLGVSKQTIAKWESQQKKIPASRIEELASIFKVNENAIVGNISEEQIIKIKELLEGCKILIL